MLTVGIWMQNILQSFVVTCKVSAPTLAGAVQP